MGCGFGHELNKFSCLGVPPQQIHGLDLIDHRVRKAKNNYPQYSISRQNALFCAYKTHSFDLVFQATCFFHLPYESRQSLYPEINRILKPGGILLWWDIHPPAKNTLEAIHLLSALKKRKLPALILATARYLFATLKNQNEPKLQIPLQLKDYHSTSQTTPPNSIQGQPPPTAQKHPLYAISSHELALAFKDYQGLIEPAGTHFDIWKGLWPSHPHLARYLFHQGYCTQHLLACLKKPL